MPSRILWSHSKRFRRLNRHLRCYDVRLPARCICRIQEVVVVVYRMAWYTAGDQSHERFDTMITMLITCRHCGSPDLTKYGSAPNGKQKYRCRTCGRQSRENPGSAAYAPERKEEILRAYQERSCQGSRHRGQKKLTTSWAS